MIQTTIAGLPERTPGRPSDDYYPTPRWAALAGLVAACVPEAPATVLDLGAGLGELAAVVDERAGGRCAIEARELDGGRCERMAAAHPAWRVVAGDALVAADLVRADLVVCNPPFRRWTAFAELAIRCTRPGGDCLVLGFVNVLGSKRRARFWNEARLRLDTIYLFRRRPSFTGDGVHDPRDCAWFHFRGAPVNGRRVAFEWI